MLKNWIILRCNTPARQSIHQMLRQSERIGMNAHFEQLVNQLNKYPSAKSCVDGEKDVIQSPTEKLAVCGIRSLVAIQLRLVLQQFNAQRRDPFVNLLLPDFLPMEALECIVRRGRTQVDVNGNRFERAWLVNFCGMILI